MIDLAWRYFCPNLFRLHTVVIYSPAQPGWRGYWTIRRYANSWIANSWTSQVVKWTTDPSALNSAVSRKRLVTPQKNIRCAAEPAEIYGCRATAAFCLARCSVVNYMYVTAASAYLYQMVHKMSPVQMIMVPELN